MTRADRTLVAVLALAALAAFPLSRALASAGDGVVVRSPAGVTVVPATDSRTLRVIGARGKMSVRVENGRACVLEADCPDQVCVRGGEVSARGRSVVCAPNGVTVTIGGEPDDAVDAIVR